MAVIQGLFQRFSHVIVQADSDTGTPGLTNEQYRDTGFNILFFRHDQDDAMFVIADIAQHKKLGATLEQFHVHCIPMVDPSVSPQNVYFEVSYTWNLTGQEAPAIASWTVTNVTMPIVTGDAFKIKHVHILEGIPPPANETYGSTFMVLIKRLGTNILDTYNTNKAGGTGAANLGLLSFGSIVPTDRLGSINPTTD